MRAVFLTGYKAHLIAPSCHCIFESCTHQHNARALPLWRRLCGRLSLKYAAAPHAIRVRRLKYIQKNATPAYIFISSPRLYNAEICAIIIRRKIEFAVFEHLSGVCALLRQTDEADFALPLFF